MTASSGTIKPHIHALDGLRAIAILMILLYHGLTQLMPEREVFSTLGWAGVDLFFLLSGFLITRQLLDVEAAPAAEKNAGLRFFYLKRFLKIVPAYYLVILLTAFCWFPYFAPEHIMQMPLKVKMLALLDHAFFMQDYILSPFLGTYWSLGVEVKFYLLAPLLVMFVLSLRTGRRRAVCMMALCLIPLFLRMAEYFLVGAPASYEEYFARFHSPFHVSSDGLLLGSAIAMFPAPAIPRRIWRLIGLLLTILVGMIGWKLNADSFSEIVLFRTLLALWFGFLMVEARHGGLLGACLSWRGWMLISAPSYRIFLIHLQMVPLTFMLHATLAENHAGTTGMISFVLLFMLLSLLAGTVLYRSFERPLYLLHRRVRPLSPSADH